MAELSVPQREALWADFLRSASALHMDLGTIVKADALAAVNALDTYINDEAANINAALPQPFRGQASTEAKALLLQLLLFYRYQKGV